MSLWKELLATAIHAPSPHNVQPWRVRILSDHRADLLIERRRTLPKEDPTGSFIILTMGLFIEALRILAANRSLKLHYEFFQARSQFTPDQIARAKSELLPFATLFIEPAAETGEGPGGPIAQLANSGYENSLFLIRRTSRISLLPKELPEEAVQSLTKLAQEWGQTYLQVTRADTIERILERNIDALFEDLNAPDYHDEIVEWFRFTDRDSRRTRDGLDYRCMNTSRQSFWLAARFPKLLQLPITRPILKRIYRKQLGIVPTIGVLGGPFWEPESAFETGRFLIHFWLELAKHDLYIHPYGNLVTNGSAATWCRQVIGVSDIWLIFKIGFSNVPPQSYRRSVEEVLVD
jgi:hypothetical protein